MRVTAGWSAGALALLASWSGESTAHAESAPLDVLVVLDADAFEPAARALAATGVSDCVTGPRDRVPDVPAMSLDDLTSRNYLPRSWHGPICRPGVTMDPDRRFTARRVVRLSCGAIYSRRDGKLAKVTPGECSGAPRAPGMAYASEANRVAFLVDAIRTDDYGRAVHPCAPGCKPYHREWIDREAPRAFQALEWLAAANFADVALTGDELAAKIVEADVAGSCVLEPAKDNVLRRSQGAFFLESKSRPFSFRLDSVLRVDEWDPPGPCKFSGLRAVSARQPPVGVVNGSRRLVVAHFEPTGDAQPTFESSACVRGQNDVVLSTQDVPWDKVKVEPARGLEAATPPVGIGRGPADDPRLRIRDTITWSLQRDGTAFRFNRLKTERRIVAPEPSPIHFYTASCSSVAGDACIDPEDSWRVYSTISWSRP